MFRYIKYVLFITAIIWFSSAMQYLPAHAIYRSTFDTTKEVFYKYITDPNNFIEINPTIKEITIDEQNDKMLNIRYTEDLLYWNFFSNFAWGRYTFDKVTDAWRVYSVHHTCFFTEDFCVDTYSVGTVVSIPTGGVVYKEEVGYSCPKLLLGVCARELDMQRELIFRNLRTRFDPDRIFRRGNRNRNRTRT